MDKLKKTIENISALMNVEIEESAGKYNILKNRTIEITAENVNFTCTLELDISFERFQNNGFALNKAEIFMLPEECKAFTLALIQHEIPFPSIYRQWQVANPNIIGMYIESVEPPEDFAARLSKAFLAIEKQLEEPGSAENIVI